MNVKIVQSVGARNLVIALLTLSAVVLNSCKKESKFAVPVNTATIRFSANAYTLERNAPVPLTVVLPLSLPLEEDATAVVTVDNQSTAATTEYTLTPVVPAAGLKLTLLKGATEVSFQLASMENFEGDKTVVLKLSAATGGLTVANTNATTTITIKGKPIVLPSITATDVTSFGNVVTGTSSPSKTYTVTGVKLTANIDVVASANFQVSLNNTAFSSSVSVPFAAANAGLVNVYVRMSPATGQNQSISGTITHSSGTIPAVITNVAGAEIGNAAPGVLLASENLNYGNTTGNLTTISGGAWKNYSGTVNFVQYVIPGLTYAGYTGSGAGGALISENGAGSREDLTWAFPSQTSGVVYVAQMMKFESAPATADFFNSIGDAATGTPGYFNRIYVKSSGGQFNIGVSRNSTTTPVYSATAYDYGTTYLVVSKFDYNSGISSLYVLSGAIPVLEPGTAAATSSGGTNPSQLISMVIRQNTTSPLKVIYDGIRVATSWKDAVGL